MSSSNNIVEGDWQSRLGILTHAPQHSAISPFRFDVIRGEYPPQLENPTKLVKLVAKDGDLEEDFIVHKYFACHYSPVLRAAFNSDFLEGQTQTYTIIDATPHAVKILVEWLYTQLINTAPIEDDAVHVQQRHLLVQLWVLGDRFLIPKLQNLAIHALNRLIMAIGLRPGLSVEYTWAHAPVGSPLRLFFLHAHAVIGEFDWYQQNLDSVPKEFLAELLEIIGDNQGCLEELLPNHHMTRYEVREIIEQ
ncbi:uncharacterized protein LY89DRAFT_763280 [Mollisia scopiformis]|uniref:BTB domain-containing protein n=1 Tax=Mollisia scopiformis TaxID=149040 RepID=A0A194XRI0_MOLSC|nr:uncharacterized protein LY89DRAFT_763280 [Mollisia scopiformis]KUJ22798.1 hypothetical protein LY89DRAFT_763280 [Mollisia scopiformis]